MSNIDADKMELGDEQMLVICRMVYKLCGIEIEPAKKELVRSRLAKRVADLGLSSFAEYIEFVRRDAAGLEQNAMAESLTTNYTFFFREMKHFEFIEERIVESIKARGGRVRIWSAGCSTGEEPYSIAMWLYEKLGAELMAKVEILATDICGNVINAAQNAVYMEPAMRNVPKAMAGKYFRRVENGWASTFRLDDSIRRAVSFARLNLLEKWPMNGNFDIVFCRNVMIYFDRKTQEALMKRFHDALGAGGFLFTGHSECLMPVRQNFCFVQPAVYQKAS